MARDNEARVTCDSEARVVQDTCGHAAPDISASYNNTKVSSKDAAAQLKPSVSKKVGNDDNVIWKADEHFKKNVKEAPVKESRKKTSSQLTQASVTKSSKSPEEIDPAPAPGSLADREHRKWEEATVQLQYNPYTRENVARRNINRSSLFVDIHRANE